MSERTSRKELEHHLHDRRRELQRELDRTTSPAYRSVLAARLDNVLHELRGMDGTTEQPKRETIGAEIAQRVYDVARRNHEQFRKQNPDLPVWKDLSASQQHIALALTVMADMPAESRSKGNGNG